MKRIMGVILLVILLAPQGGAFSGEHHEIYNRAPGFTVPDGVIVYLGCFYSPEKIWMRDRKDKSLYCFNPQIPPAAQAVSEMQAAFLNQAGKLKMTVESAPATLKDQLAVLGHLFHPDDKKFQLKPKLLSKLCGDKPYGLIGIIDYYGTFSSEIQVRENSDGNVLNYWRKRSILEKDRSTQHYHKITGLELFLFSTKDGSLLWQAHGVEQIEHIFLNSFKDTANNAMEHELKDLIQLRH